ncbi:MAG TPA: hypothetical protein VM901_03190 [Bdellovibrionota bacterium]|jgi:hypothetical protein|nr:hypothetical protein [Bdellovibrionota bacterium]
MKKLLVLSVLAASYAQAVEVKNCPPALEVSLKGVTLQSLESVYVSLRDYDLNDEERSDVARAYRETKALEENVTQTWALTKAESGRCVYEDTKSKLFEKAELYTKDGKNTLLFQIEVEPKSGIILRSYSSFDSIKTDFVVTSDESASLHFGVPRSNYDSFRAGGAMAKVGKAKVRAFAKKTAD